MTLTWYRHFWRNGGLNQILRRQTSRSHYGSKVPAVTVTVFKYRNKIGKIVFKAVPWAKSPMISGYVLHCLSFDLRFLIALRYLQIFFLTKYGILINTIILQNNNINILFNLSKIRCLFNLYFLFSFCNTQTLV